MIFTEVKENLAFSEKDEIFLYQTDSFVFMQNLINKNITDVFDVIFVDPPYFLSNDGFTCQNGKFASVNKGIWDKQKEINEIHKFNTKWIELCKTLLKETGTIWISGTMHNIYSIGLALQQLNFKILNDIIWVKPSPPPNLSGRYFTHSHETVIWAAKHKKAKYYFNYELMKKLNNNKQMKDIWFFSPPGKNEKQFGKHPTQKPLRLIEQIILASSKENDLIFDPFCGSSTTAIACIKNKRKFIGCELEKEYIDLSIKRIKNEIKNQNQSLF